MSASTRRLSVLYFSAVGSASMAQNVTLQLRSRSIPRVLKRHRSLRLSNQHPRKSSRGL